MPSVHISRKKANVMGDEKLENTVWEVWANGPLTKDAELLVKWSKTSFYKGYVPPEPKRIDGKDFILYHRCNSEAWARERFSHAIQYFGDVRLMINGEQVLAKTSSKDSIKPDDDMLGAYSRLGVRGGGC